MERAPQASPLAAIPPPAAELWLIAGIIVELSRGKPERVDRMTERLRRFVENQRELVNVVNIRGPEQQEANRLALESAMIWLDRARPVLRLLAAQKDI